MARITVEDCLTRENNRFSLVTLAAERAKQLLSGRPAVTDTKGNRAVVSALREIAAGKVFYVEEEEVSELEDILNVESASLPVKKVETTAEATPVESKPASETPAPASEGEAPANGVS